MAYSYNKAESHTLRGSLCFAPRGRLHAKEKAARERVEAATEAAAALREAADRERRHQKRVRANERDGRKRRAAVYTADEMMAKRDSAEAGEVRNTPYVQLCGQLPRQLLLLP